MKISREIKTAILAIASISLFIWGYSFLKGSNLFSDYKTFYVQYKNVEGLAPSAPVTLNGLIIGKVNSIKIQDKTGNLVVELQIKSDFTFSKSSKINIYDPGFIGGKQIQIVPDFNDKNIAISGDYLNGVTIPGLTTLVGEKLSPLQAKVEKMISNADLLMTNLNNVLDTKTKENLRQSIENLDKTLLEFSKASKTVNGMLAENKQKINGTLNNLDLAAHNFSTISDSLAKIKIGKTVKTLENTLAKVDNIMLDMQAGKGTMGKLLKDDQLYTNVSKTSKELELLLQDMRLNPTRYVNVSLFGKKNKPYQAPTTDSLKN